MSSQITTAMVHQFAANINLLSQQKGSRLRKCVHEEPLTGEKGFTEQIGPTEAVEKTSRHDDTPLVETPHDRRMVVSRTFRWADLIDDDDKVKLLADPTSKYAINGTNALGRKIDDVILEAMLGTAYTGKAGTTATPLPDTQKVALGSAGLTVAKLRLARKILMKNDVDLTDEQAYIAVTAEQLDNMLGTTEVTSADYNSVKALVNGQIDTFLGFKFIHTQRLSLSGTTRSCPVWVPTGVEFAVAGEIKTKITERADKNYATQVWLQMIVGATRLEETKVVEIACKES